MKLRFLIPPVVGLVVAAQVLLIWAWPELAIFVPLLGVALAFAIAIAFVKPMETLTKTLRSVGKDDRNLPVPLPHVRHALKELEQLHTATLGIVTTFRKYRSRCYRLAFIDRTTALASQECFRRRVETFLQNAKVGDEASLICLDLDGFRAVNDAIGRDAGDDVLGQVGARLRLVVGQRMPDPLEPLLATAAMVPTIARLEGDAFAVFLPGTGRNAAVQLAERIRGKLGVPFPQKHRMVTFGASLGVAHLPGDATDCERLVRAAEMAMHDAKRAGKNCVRKYCPDPQEPRAWRRRTAADLFSQDLEAQIDTLYQPFYRSDDLSLAGVEVRVGSCHPKHRFLSQDAIFEMAAELGLRRRIDEIIFDRAIADMQAVVNTHRRLPELSLPVAVERLSEEVFVSRLLERIPLPFQLSLELADTAYPEILADRVQWGVDRLREAGVRFAVSNFGSMHGSISAILQLAPHRVCIDGSLSGHVHQNEGCRRLFTSLLGMTHGLEVEVIAKDVDTLDQIDCFRDMRADLLQGFALNRPLSTDELTAHLRGPAHFDEPKVQHPR